MWGWVDHLGGVVSRGGLSAAVLTSLAMLAMLCCRQPARRIALARSTALGLLLLVPLVALAPLPRFGVVASLRDAGILPHPLLTTTRDADDAGADVPPPGDEAGARPSSTGDSSPRTRPGAVWKARGLVLAYLAGAGACLVDLMVGFWGLGWLIRRSSAPSPPSQALYDALPFSGRGARPRLRVAARVGRPVLLGGLRPTILIPTSLDEAADAGAPGATEALRLSFLHELAHAERSDPWFSLAGSLAQAFWFFLPTLWWIRARMQLDHEFLADRNASLRFDAPGLYASSLVGMAAPRPSGQPGPSTRAAGRPAGEVGVGMGGSSLFQRVLMLVQCPFAIETRPPAWCRWSLPLLTLLLTPAAACLSLDPGDDALASPPWSSSDGGPKTFRMARLAIAPRNPGPGGRTPAVELPLRLPEQFDLTLEVWGSPALLSRCRVVGQPLGPPDIDAPPRDSTPPLPASVPEAWHLVQLRVRRDPDVLALSVDGRPIPVPDDREKLPPRLCIESPPGRSTRFRKILVTWNPGRPASPSP